MILKNIVCILVYHAICYLRSLTKLHRPYTYGHGKCEVTNTHGVDDY